MHPTTSESHPRPFIFYRPSPFLLSQDAPAASNADYRLYAKVPALHGAAAHSQFNALIRQLVSFERALEYRISRET